MDRWDDVWRYCPVNMEHRDWVQTDACVKQSKNEHVSDGDVHGVNQLVNRVPSRASSLNRGVLITGLPVQPSESYRSWSGMNMMLDDILSRSVQLALIRLTDSSFFVQR
jgi:hypothetical protein